MLEPVGKETGSSEIDIPMAATWGREKVKVIYKGVQDEPQGRCRLNPRECKKNALLMLLETEIHQ